MQALVGSSERETMPAMSPSARLHAAQRALSERAMVAWGLLNIGIVIISMFLASPIGYAVGVNVGNLNKYFMFSLVAWIMVALLRNLAPLRLPAAIILMSLVQIWFTVSSVVSQIQLSRSLDFSAPDYSLMSFLLCFIQGSMLTYFAPHVRVLLKRLVVGLAIVSAFVAILQFLGFGPAIAYANLMIAFQDITDWAGQGGIRASGIFGGLVLQSSYCLIGIGMIASALYSRKLTGLEIATIILLTGIMFMAQVRSMLVVIAIVMISLVVFFVRKHRMSAMPYVVLGTLALVLLILKGGDRFDYMFSGDTSTFDWRTDVLWPQAWHIYAERPWFGVGVEPDFIGVRTFVTGLWSSGYIMDNGYLVALAFGGLPALALLIMTVIAAVFSSIKLLLRRTAQPIDQAFALTAVIVTLLFGYGMYFNNLYTNISSGMLYFILIGAALPSRPSSEPSSQKSGGPPDAIDGRQATVTAASNE